LRVDGLCNTTAPARRQLSNGAEVLCHRTELDLISLQKQIPAVREGTVV
jgi:peptide/nickel transport system ATP-binding protein